MCTVGSQNWPLTSRIRRCALACAFELDEEEVSSRTTTTHNHICAVVLLDDTVTFEIQRKSCVRACIKENRRSDRLQNAINRSRFLVGNETNYVQGKRTYDSEDGMTWQTTF